MKFKPIKKRERVYQVIIQQIKDAIEKGEILPGDKLLSERSMSEVFGVSRTSVKEAVTVLASSGVITVRPGVGMFLNNDTDKNLLSKLSQIIDKEEASLRDLIELRQAIEGGAAYYSALRITDTQKEKLQETYQELILAEKQAELGIEEDFQFHYSIVEAANNPVMLEVMNLISDRIYKGLKEVREISTKNETYNQQVLEEHEQIFQSIMNKQPDDARKAVWDHFEQIKKRHEQILEKNNTPF